jgi:hypothetical protein
MRILGETSSLVSVKENIVNVKRSGNKRLVVSNRRSLRTAGSGVKRLNGPQALVNRTNVKVNFDLVVLESNQRKSKPWVGAKPELKRNVKGCLRKSVSGSTHLTRSVGIARTINVTERRISDECQCCGVSNHLEISTLLLGGHGKLIPDVHPVTILTIYSLTAEPQLER